MYQRRPKTDLEELKQAEKEQNSAKTESKTDQNCPKTDQKQGQKQKRSKTETESGI